MFSSAVNSEASLTTRRSISNDHLLSLKFDNEDYGQLRSCVGFKL